jgi:photosystem II stability/assembly factor-like uncharacterized protein
MSRPLPNFSTFAHPNVSRVLWALGAIALWANLPIGAVAQTPTSKVADGELHACDLVTVEQAWAVGDRGLILATNDAGKSWNVQGNRSEFHLYTVCFSNENIGWAMGGCIEPYTHRSIGVVLTTKDAGRTWQSLPCSLPRITGSRRLGKDHLLAWGDWSNVYQSSLFESIDGGNSWSSRPTPCSHIQAAASDSDGTLVVVDRLGKVYRTSDGSQYQPIAIPTTPFEPLRFCKWIDGCWWLGGDHGKLFRSTDAVQWVPIRIPGSQEDLELISLRDIAGRRERLCCVGNPGNVVWITEDLGISWTVAKAGDALGNNSISVLNADVMLICGPLASIRATRNGGKAWWPQHQSGSRVAVLNVASTSNSVAWDLMTYVAQEAKRTTAIHVLHEQCFEERSSHRPEVAARFEAAAKTIHSSDAIIFSNTPVGNLYSGSRPSDLTYYGRKPYTDSEIANLPMMRQWVQQIRSTKPDVLVCNSPDSEDMLESLSARSMDMAKRLASNADYRVFSSVSGIPHEPWNVQRILERSTKPGISYAPAMLLKTSNVFLGTSLAQVRPILELDGSLEFPKSPHFYRPLSTKSSQTSRDPLEGVLLDPSTQLTERVKAPTKLPMIMATGKLLDWKNALEIEPGNPLVPDRIWDNKIQSLLKDIPASTAGPILVDIARHSRQAGEWYRWQSALDQLISLDAASAYGEIAFWELMVHTGSLEVRRVIDAQIKDLEQRSIPERSLTAQAIQQASPFATSNLDATSIQPATFLQLPSIARVRNASEKDLSEFTRLFARWPEKLQPRRSEPHWSWLIAARYRAMKSQPDSSEGLDLSRSPSVFFPQIAPPISNWKLIRDAEHQILNELEPPQDSPPVPSPSLLMPIHWTGQRPFLDGKLDDGFWKRAATMELRDPWSTNKAKTILRFARDEEFLYIFSQSPKTPTIIPSSSVRSSPGGGESKENRHDQLRTGMDHIKIRFDLDRDYATWFELGWSTSGQTWDACNDMIFWNPTWYRESTEYEGVWCSEIAIPLNELVRENAESANPHTKQVWAVQAMRCIPSMGSYSMEPFVSDRMSPENWAHLDMSPPQPAAEDGGLANR